MRMRCNTQVCTIANGQVASIDSGSPFNPSHTTMQASSTPRFLISVSTASQYLAPSPPVPTHGPKMSRLPSTVTPIAAYTGRLATWPSRILTTIASMNTTGYTRRGAGSASRRVLRGPGR